MANRVIWFPTGARSKSSSRIQVFNIHEKLLSLGYDSTIGYEPKRTIWHLPINKGDIDRLNLKKDDVVIIQKFKKKSIKKVLELLKATPATVGYIDCDAPIISKELADLVDFVIVPSIYLKEKYEQLGAKCTSIPDCPEKYLSPATQVKSNETLKCVWFGNYSKSKWKEVQYFESILKQNNITNWQFETISNTSKATKRWNKNSFDELRKYDLAVIPVPEMSLDYKVKSANRLLQSMALGIPVIASPIPSYQEIIDESKLENIICNNDNDWANMLDFFSSSENRANSLEKNFKIAQSYSLDHVIDQWVKAIGITKNTDQTSGFDNQVLNRIKTKARLLGYEIRMKL